MPTLNFFNEPSKPTFQKLIEEAQTLLEQAQVDLKITDQGVQENPHSFGSLNVSQCQKQFQDKLEAMRTIVTDYKNSCVSEPQEHLVRRYQKQLKVFF